MIRCLLRDSSGQCHSGDSALLEDFLQQPGQRLWIDIEGELDSQTEAILASLDCNALSIKDCFRHRHPPKFEVFENNTFILYRGFSTINDSLELSPQQVGLWVGENYLISVHRGHSVSVQHHWQKALTNALENTVAELALSVLHFASGHYLEVLLNFEESLSDLEDVLLDDCTEAQMKQLVVYRSNLRRLRRVLSYHDRLAREIVDLGSPHIGAGEDETIHARRDLLDRCERNYSLCNLYYELCGDLVEGHISLSSHKLNQTMKVLTILSVVFVPLTFMAGIYGMNFEYMPELGWRNAYFVLLGVMGVTAVAMLAYFRRIKWL